MIAPRRITPSAVPLQSRRHRARRSAPRSAHMARWSHPAPALWELFLDDRRALRLKWGLLILLLVVAALLDVPL